MNAVTVGFHSRADDVMYDCFAWMRLVIDARLVIGVIVDTADK